MAKKENPTPWERPDSWYDAQSAEGQRIKENPRSIMPALAGWNQEPEGRDVLVSALMGFGKSMQAAQQASALGDPLSAAFAAIGGAAGQPGPQAVAQQRMMAQFESIPVDHLSPELVKEFPEIGGMPLGLIQKIAPLIAESGRKKRADMAAHAASGAVGSLYTDPDTGMMFRIKPGHKGNELIPLPGQAIGPDGKVLFQSEEREKAALRPKELGAEAGVKVSMARDGLTNLADIRAVLDKPNARELIIKAGGSWKKLSSLGDPEAEALANAIFQVADAEARIKTGAAINEKEVEAYFNGLVPKTGTIDGIKDRLNRKQRYFESLEGTLTFGKRTNQGGGGGAGDSVQMMTPDGKIWTVPAANVAAAERRGAKRL